MEGSLVVDEHHRRSSLGLGRVDSLSVLSYLTEMPADLPWPRLPIPAAVKRSMPNGCVDIEGDHIVRRLVPPLVVDSVYAHGQSWRILLEHATRFAPYATRFVWVDRIGQTSSAAAKAAEAALWGIGIVEGPNRHVAVAADAFRQLRWTPASWLFSEIAYGFLIQHQRLRQGWPSPTP